ncbi:hypothetical protein L0665_06530 [Methanogenium marinum]|uniref:Uncharacterized protein n=1 Tax=Methanogenium marinum TaxID=348610 RepID=A0A9Q4KTD6_9EURY|nr:hypothetical protein [Methanogenium marinum]MDE4908264.1 hypothetical protein [Methanogenium marinum]
MLYGEQGTVIWVVVCTALHGIVALFFAGVMGPVGRMGIFVGFLLLVAANVIIIRGGTPEAGMRALPLFHGAIVVYAVSILLEFFV